jgi:PTH1 family peptidyl-tRNA hydrolase
VGLGNPGEDYARTRHNAGFRVVEALADAEGIRIRSKESRARVGRGTIGGERVLLALPQTFMNASGEAVSALCQKNGIEPENLCVVLDEIELPLGTLRMRKSGSAGGHNGLASVLSGLGRSDVPRLRVGVRGSLYRKGDRDLADYVLEPFARDERGPLEDAVARAVEALRLWVTEGVDSAMRYANAKASSPGSASDPD